MSELLWNGLAMLALVQMGLINLVAIGIGAMIIKDALTPKEGADALPA